MTSIYVYSLIVFFIVSILYIIIRYCRKSKTIEGFEEFQYKFLKPLEAYHVINNSGYFNNFNTSNIRARLCANVTDCRYKYKKELVLIDPMEEEAIKWVINNMINRLKQCNTKLVSLLNIPIKFAKFTLKLEDNMPHTHDDVIFLPESTYNKLWSLHQQTMNYNNDKLDYAIKNYGSTIIHELTHILQRKYEDRFINFYQQQWYFDKIEPSAIQKHNNIFDRARLNPDGIDMGWVWVNPYSKQHKHPQEYYLLMATFKNDHPKYLGDVDNNVYKLEKTINNYQYRIANAELISNNIPLLTFFGKVSNNYHPNEISAEYMSHYAMKMLDIPTEIDLNNNCMAYNSFVQFIKSLK
jgi:hypothetical protein